MYSRANYTVVGIFVVLFGVASVLFAFWLAKYGFEQKYRYYKTYFTESVAGLSRDSVVYLHGVEVGRVKAIRIDPKRLDKVEVVLAIKEEIPVMSDMYATTTMLGVTGLLSIELEGGTDGKSLRPEKEDDMPVIPSRSSWRYTVKQHIDTLSKRLQNLTESLDEVLSEKNRRHFANILEKADTLASDTASLLTEANRTVVTMKETFRTLRKSLEDAVKNVNDFARYGKPAIEKLTKAAKDFNRLTLKVERTLERGDYNLRKILEPMTVDMHLLSNKLGEAIESFEESPSDLFFKSRPHRKGPGE